MSSPSPQSANVPFGLLEPPKELREEVYGWIFASPDDFLLSSLNRRAENEFSDLFLALPPAFHNEAMTILLQTSVLRLTPNGKSLAEDQSEITRMTDFQLRNIRWINLDLCLTPLHETKAFKSDWQDYIQHLSLFSTLKEIQITLECSHILESLLSDLDGYDDFIIIHVLLRPEITSLARIKTRARMSVELMGKMHAEAHHLLSNRIKNEFMTEVAKGVKSQLPGDAPVKYFLRKANPRTWDELEELVL